MTITAVWDTWLKPGADAEGLRLTQQVWSDMRNFDGYLSHQILVDQNAPGHIIALAKWRSRVDDDAVRDGPSTGLALIDAILAHGDLTNYHLAHSARADLCRRLGQTAEARTSYERAFNLTQQEPERRLLERRLRELQD
jgi:predicted RNA polymerase sigma factor